MQRSLSGTAAALCAAVFFCAAAAAQARGGALDPLNLFVVVEADGAHVTLLDGDRLESLHRFATRPSLQGEPQFSPDGRYVYFATRAGLISKLTPGSEDGGRDPCRQRHAQPRLSSDGRLVAIGSAARSRWWCSMGTCSR
jgi:hypothetical protein